MKKVTVFIIFNLFFTLFLFSQPAIEWSKNYGLSGDEVGGSIVQTTDGNFVISSGQSSESTSSIWIIKINPSGDLIWEKNIPESAIIINYPELLRKTNDGGVILSAGISDFTENVKLIKIDTSGTTEWEYIMNVEGFSDMLSILETNDNNILIVGATANNDGRMHLLKLSSTGNLIWSKKYEGDADFSYPTSAIQLSGGDFVISGIETSFTIGPARGNLNSSGSWILKIKNNGDIDWEYKPEVISFIKAIRETNDGNLMAYGEKSTDTGQSNISLLKLSPTGDLIFEKNLADDYSGNSSMTTTIDNGFLIVKNTTEDEFPDYEVLKTDENGMLIWKKTYGGSNVDIPVSIIQGTNGRILISGYSKSNDGDVSGNNGDFDIWVLKLTNEECLSLITHPNEEVNSNIYKAEQITSKAIVEPDSIVTYKAEVVIELGDGFHAKQGSHFIAKIEGCPNSAIVENEYSRVVLNIGSEDNKRETATLALSPNPSSNIVNIDYYLPKKEQAKISLYTINGQLVKDFGNLGYSIGKNNISYNISELPIGVYICTLQTDSSKVSFKLIKN